MIRALLTAAYLLLLVSLWLLPADARMHAPYRGHRISPAGGAPPLDGFTAASRAYSFRKLRSAYAGSAVQIRRTSGAPLTQDIGFVGFVPGLGSPWDAAVAAAFCNAGPPCYIKIRYDQSGNGQDETSVDANNPALVLNCTGSGNSLPCMQTTAATVNLLGPSFTPATGLGTVAVVAMRSAQAAGGCAWYRVDGNNNRLTAAATANNWTLNPGATFTASATDAAWHAAVGVLHPTAGSSVLNIDGVEATGTTVPVTTAGVNGEVGGTSPTCSHGEAIYWDAYNMPPAERAFVIGNARGYWGTP